MKSVHIYGAMGLGVLVLICCSRAGAETDPQIVARQLREFFLGQTAVHHELPKPAESAAMRYIETMKPNGSWGNIDYSSGDRADWPAFDQLTRVLAMVTEARRPETSAADAAKCLAAAHTALGFWIEHDFQCPNWWFNQIGVPKTFGNIALLLDQEMTPAERSYILDVAMARSKVGTMTGQNRTWLASIGVMRAAEKNDDALLTQAANVIRNEIRVSTDEGLQPDWSFHQHGPQQQFGNYGLSYAGEMTQWATVFRGTKYAIDGEKLGMIRNYLLQGQAWIAWRGAMDISSCGRQLAPWTPHEKVDSMVGVMKAMSLADPANEADYQAYVTRNRDGAANDLVGNRCFWRSDYIVHRRPDWMATLKMYSTRVIGGETVNSENLCGAHLADGATFFYRTGHEYDDIFPVWNWRKIPGTTSVQTSDPIVWPDKKNPLKATAFVGGVSDGASGCAAMDFDRDGIRAKKAWFFSGDVVACLGTDITSSGSEPVVTTINQSLLHRPVTIGRGGEVAMPSTGLAKLDDVDWVEQDGLRYVFPMHQGVVMEAGPRAGNWASVFKTASTPKGDVTKDMFTLWLNHGVRPHDASYGYFIEPAGIDDGNITIQSNSAMVQAVSVGQNWGGAVFWSAGKVIINGVAIGVDHPCILLQTSSNGENAITVADPTEQLKTLEVDVNGKPVEVPLPQGGDAGKSAKVVLGGNG